MIWRKRDPDRWRKRFAVFPMRIGERWVWLRRYAWRPLRDIDPPIWSPDPFSAIFSHLRWEEWRLPDGYVVWRRLEAFMGSSGMEMSAHHYFRDFFYCDSGMVPWLLVVELMGMQELPLSALVDERMLAFPASGEINASIEDPPALIESIAQRYVPDAESVDYTDGLSVSYPNWRFNLRMSNTEPVVRLNVESRGDETLMQEKTQELLALIGAAPTAN